MRVYYTHKGYCQLFRVRLLAATDGSSKFEIASAAVGFPQRRASFKPAACRGEISAAIPRRAFPTLQLLFRVVRGSRRGSQRNQPARASCADRLRVCYDRSEYTRRPAAAPAVPSQRTQYSLIKEYTFTLNHNIKAPIIEGIFLN